MRWVLRVLGTWFLGLALILLVVDGTRMLAADSLLFSTLGELWAQIAPDGPAALQESVQTYVHPLLWDPVLTTFLAWPGWAVLGGIGIVLMIVGRARTPRRYVSQDQF